MKALFKRLKASAWTALLACAAMAACGMVSVSASEKVTLNMPGGKALRCDVVKIGGAEVHVKPEGEKVQVLPFALLSPKEVCACYKQALEPNNAALRFEMGVYFLKKELFDEARIELVEAAVLDGSLKGRADALLKIIPNTQAAPAVVKNPSDDKKTATKASDESKPATAKSSDTKPKTSEESASRDDYRKRFMRRDVPPLSDAKMKEFLDKRLDDLNKLVGGTWRLVETKHYYCFANIAENKHRYIATQWNETLYDMLCSVLRHHDGDKLWNNKMPVYYFDTFKQFQRFAVAIDRSPGVAISGGYFSADGRDVHICVPFMSERTKGNTNRMDEMARSTICHEGTHAFLQLSGDDVPLPIWLHEGMAQFMEFLNDAPDNSDRRDTLIRMKEVMISNRGNPPTWDQTKDRPSDGTDMAGYCCAYAKLEFLYRNFDHQDLPKFIRLIKSGKTENDALETVFRMKPDKLEDGYRKWIKEAAKNNFTFSTTP